MMMLLCVTFVQNTLLPLDEGGAHVRCRPTAEASLPFARVVSARRRSGHLTQRGLTLRISADVD